MCLKNIRTVKPDLTTTCEQRPPVNNGHFESSTASQNLSFIRHLCLTAAFFRSQGWPLYTGLTVFIEEIVYNYSDIFFSIHESIFLSTQNLVKQFFFYKLELS